MQIFVKLPAGRLLTLQVEPTDTVAALQARVRELADIPSAQLRLFFAGNAGRPLEGARTLADYGVQIQSTVHVMLAS